MAWPCGDEYHSEPQVLGQSDLWCLHNKGVQGLISANQLSIFLFLLALHGLLSCVTVCLTIGFSLL